MNLTQRVEVEPAVGRLPAPRELEVGEVAGVDLIERRALRAAEVAAVGAPLAVRGTVLGVRRTGPKKDGEQPTTAESLST